MQVLTGKYHGKVRIIQEVIWIGYAFIDHSNFFCFMVKNDLKTFLRLYFKIVREFPKNHIDGCFKYWFKDLTPEHGAIPGRRK
jgi:hypothetical protein